MNLYQDVMVNVIWCYLPKNGTVADDIAKRFDYFTYTVSDVITVCDGRCWTYTVADVIALFNNVVDVSTTCFVDY